MKRIVCCLLILAVFFSVSAALAQKAACYEGGFSLDLPDDFVMMSTEGDPELCFYWSGNGGSMTVQAYFSYQGEVAGSDLFQVFDGSEMDYGTRTYNGMNMQYVRTQDSYSGCIMYSWMYGGNNISLYFYYPANDSSAVDAVRRIMNSISFSGY